MFENKNKHFKSLKTNEECLQEIVNIISNYESQMLVGKYQLSLTLNFLAYYDEESKKSSSLDYEDDCVDIESKTTIMKRFFRRLKSLKITSVSKYVHKPINLSHFPSLNSLELENLNIDDIKNLDSFRSQIKNLTLRKCTFSKSSFTSFFQKNTFWPLLRSLTITSTNLEKFDSSMFPNSLKHLNLSWNFISSFKIDNLFHISSLDLSFNRLTFVPKFDKNDLLSNSLEVLKLQGNLISNLQGLENLTALIELDLSENFIINKNHLISTLSKCSNLKIISILNNPVCHSPNLLSSLSKAPFKLISLNGLAISNALISKITVTHSSSSALRPTILNFNNQTDAESNIRLVRSSSIKSETDSDTKVKPREQKTKPKARVALILDETEQDDIKNINQTDQENLPTKDLPQFEFDSEICDLTSQNFNFKDSLDISTIDKVRLNFDNLINISSENLTLYETAQYSEKCNDGDIEVIKDDSRLESNWTEDDTDIIENMFLVETKNNKSVFLFVKDEIIYEKDCITGDVRTSHDLNVLSNAEFVDNNPLALKLFFDSRVKNKEEIIYIFEDESSFSHFKEIYISPFITKRNYQLSLKLESNFSLIHCLKCSFKQLSENDQSKNCPQCGSQYTFLSIQ